MSESVKMTPVQSSNVHAVGHDGQALFIQFKDKDGTPGKTYRYAGVAASHKVAMIGDKSPGGYFAKHIRAVHVGKPVDMA